MATSATASNAGDLNAGSATRRQADFVAAAATVGVVVVGVAIIEAALIPGIAIGAAAFLAQKLVSRRQPDLKKRVQSLFNSVVPPYESPSPETASPSPSRSLLPALPRLQVKQALAKTITFRVIVTSLDFGWNYVIIGELATAAGLSAFSLVVGPMCYFLHETAWNYFGPTHPPKVGPTDTAVAANDIIPPGSEKDPNLLTWRGFTLRRALAKTIIYQTFGSTMDYTVNYVVVGDPVTAAVLSAPRFIIGPLVYYGHEMAWDYFDARRTEIRPALQ